MVKGWPKTFVFTIPSHVRMSTNHTQCYRVTIIGEPTLPILAHAIEHKISLTMVFV